MRAVDWVDPSYPYLLMSDTVEDALTKIQSLVGCTELAFRCEDGSFGGFFVASELDHTKLGESVASNLSKREAKVQIHVPHYEVLRVSQSHRGSSVAVVDAKGKYIGIISPRDMVAGMSFFSAIRSPGSIIKIEVRQEDYMLSEITRLIEENRSKILSLSVIQDAQDTHLLSISIKLSTQDSSSVQKALIRHGYQVSAEHGSSDALDKIEHSNYEHLMKYLSI